jgi:type II secretory pathway pseudopilin PulG
VIQVRRRDNERGFALLIVFLLAAVVALMLYQQLPRVAFESQREKEQLLIDRGEQYKRAIQMYFVAFKKYPSKIEDLENTNNKRFLRRRYIDPMTGKDEWRLIHVNAAGQLTDSQVQKPPSQPLAGLLRRERPPREQAMLEQACRGPRVRRRR